MEIYYTEEEIRNFPRCALCGRIIFPDEPIYGNFVYYCEYCWFNHVN
jgi:hypothetical protein|nr:MAG TPA: Cytoplasmic polyadenylation element-binding protein [Caudoviricetes sp.]DAY73228.1 MAG TPA: Cytoplasmic polyadenylation element-binding protein [Caudoviricetes sp.]